MKLTQETHVALSALTDLGCRPGGAIVGSAELADRINVSPAFLSKILQRLGAAGIVRGHRGRQRGYSLALPADRTSVRAVAEALEGESLFERCVFWTDVCSDVHPCPLHDMWKRIRPIMRDEFTALTIAELARRKTRGGVVDVPLAAPPPTKKASPKVSDSRSTAKRKAASRRKAPAGRSS
jgi:Rrf2 family iron-sulfur cluster assembly transcriptional regulator